MKGSLQPTKHAQSDYKAFSRVACFIVFSSVVLPKMHGVAKAAARFRVWEFEGSYRIVEKLQVLFGVLHCEDQGFVVAPFLVFSLRTVLDVAETFRHPCNPRI